MTRASWGVRGAAVAMAWVKANFPGAKMTSYAPAASLKNKHPQYAFHIDPGTGTQYEIPQPSQGGQSAMDLVWTSGGQTYNAEVKSVKGFTVPTSGPNKVKMKLTLELKDKGHMGSKLFPSGHQIKKGKLKRKTAFNKAYKPLFSQPNKSKFDKALQTLGATWGHPTNAMAKAAFLHELVEEDHDYVIFVGDTHAVGVSMDVLSAAEVDQPMKKASFSNYGTSGDFRPALSLTFRGTVARLSRTAGTAANNPVLGQQTGESGSFVIDDILDPARQAALIIDYIDIVQKQYRPNWEFVFQTVDPTYVFHTQKSTKDFYTPYRDIIAWLDGAGATIRQCDQVPRKDAVKENGVKINTMQGFQAVHQIRKNPADPESELIWRYEDPAKYPCAFYPVGIPNMPEVPAHFGTRATEVRNAIKRIRKYYFELPGTDLKAKEDKMYFGLFAFLRSKDCTLNNLFNIQTATCGPIVDLADRLNCKPISKSNHVRQWENVLWELRNFDPSDPQYSQNVDNAPADQI